MIGLGGIQSGETVDKVGRIDFVHIIEIEVHGDQEPGTGVFCQGHGFHAVKIADDIFFVSSVIVSAVDGKEHGVTAVHSLLQSVIETAVSRVIDREVSQPEDKTGFFVSSLPVGVQFFMGSRYGGYLDRFSESLCFVDPKFFDGRFRKADLPEGLDYGVSAIIPCLRIHFGDL